MAPIPNDEELEQLPAYASRVAASYTRLVQQHMDSQPDQAAAAAQAQPQLNATVQAALRAEAAAEAMLALRSEWYNNYGFRFAPDQTMPPQPPMVLPSMEDLELLKRRSGDEGFVRGLLLGIGIHHAGLSRNQRRMVELLFREKKLGLVLCTTTLSLGVQMPCRTVVISGNSRFLTPTEYRQMSGRAGRRGVDDRGHIVFFNTSTRKLSSLQATLPSSIMPNTPNDASVLLRHLRYQWILFANNCAADQRYKTCDLRALLMPFQSHQLGIQVFQPAQGLLGRCLLELYACIGLMNFTLAEAPVVVERQQSVDVRRQTSVQSNWDGSEDEEEGTEEAPPVLEKVRLNGLANLAARLSFLEPFNLFFCYLLQSGGLLQLHRELPAADFKKQMVLLCAHFVEVLLPFGREKDRIRASCHDSQFIGLLPEPHAILTQAGEAFNAIAVGSFERVSSRLLTLSYVICHRSCGLPCLGLGQPRSCWL